MKPLLSNPVVLDYETIEILPDGSTIASTEFYRPNFRASSCAFSERKGGKLHSWYVDGEDLIRAELKKLEGRPLICHNLQFESGVSRCRFPEITFNWYADTMRMSQNFDNGGDENSFEMVYLEPEDEGDVPDAKKESTSGFGLVKCAKRILGKENHKKEAHEWILANVPEAKKGREGQFLDKLPPDIMERYNISDTETTYELYEYLTSFFASIQFDWTFDHSLYASTVYHLVDAKIRGVQVNRPQLAENREVITEEIESIGALFEKHFSAEIVKVERLKLLENIRKKKTLRGRKNYVKRMRSNPEKWSEEIAFNVGSNKQLEMLFCGVLGMEAKFLTEKGSPSFKSSMLSQWGDGGEMLGKRRKRALVQSQATNLLAVSEFDGRWHLDIKASGTSTGRLAGGKQ